MSAVKTQVWIAVRFYVLVAMLKKGASTVDLVRQPFNKSEPKAQIGKPDRRVQFPRCNGTEVEQQVQSFFREDIEKKLTIHWVGGSFHLKTLL